MQTLAIFGDAFRRLRAQKMFWIVLILSAMIVGSFGLVGLDENGMSVLFWHFGSEEVNSRRLTPEEFYGGAVFAGMGVGLWLAYPAVLLALISTASIFPDLVSGGSVALMLSKPIGRVRVFLTVYTSGLLFVGLQVLVFCAASFLVLRFRGGYWDAQVFWAVPLVVCVFSYLHCVCTLVGVATRSTLTALLLTLLLWACLFILHGADVQLIAFSTAKQDDLTRVQARRARIRRELPRVRKDIRALTRGPATTPASPGAIHPSRVATRAALTAFRNKEARLLKQLGEADKELAEIPESIATFRDLHKVVYKLKTPLPKIEETSQLTKRFVLGIPRNQRTTFRRARRHAAAAAGSADEPNRPDFMEWMHRGAEAAYVEIHSRSLWWVLGTSLAFEAVVLAAGAWIFARRDY